MSTRTVADKLLIKPGSRLWLSHPDRIEVVGPLPQGVERVEESFAADVRLLFVDDSASLENLLREHGAGLASAGGVTWFAYPKGNRVDINRDSLWPKVAEHGMRPISQVAVDEIWSALRFRPLRDGEKQFSGGKG